MQRSGLHFCSPASQTRPSPSGPTGPGAQPGRGRRRSAPKPPAHGRLVEACPPSISPPDTMHGQSYSSPASVTSVQGNCGPRGLALSPPLCPGRACGFFACSKSQGPGPALHLVGLPGPSLPQRALADRCCPWAPVPSPPALLSSVPHKTSSLAVSWVSSSVVRRASPSCGGARQQGPPDQQPCLPFPLTNTCSFL